MSQYAPYLYEEGKRNKENLILAVEEVKQKKLSLKKAAEKYDIKGRLAKMIAELAECSYPIGKTEIKLMAKYISDKSKIMEKRFKNSIARDNWVHAFAKRNKLSNIAPSNIK